MLQVWRGDCLKLMQALRPESVDAIVCDPPYGLEFMGKEWDKLTRNCMTPEGKADQKWNATHSPTDEPGTKSGMGRRMRDRPDIGGSLKHANQMQEWHYNWAVEALRVAKPGAHLVAFGGTRTFHRLACAIEDAGWEIRDTLSWMYGSGFPKSLDVSKAMDKRRDDNPDRQAVGAWLRGQREAKGLQQKQVAAHWPSVTGGLTGCVANWEGGFNCPTWDQWLDLKRFIGFGDEMDAEVWRLNGRKGQPGEAYMERPPAEYESAPGMRESWTNGKGWNGNHARGGEGVTDLAKQWDGWGTALKPGWEPIILARKPLAGTVAANVSEWGTGAINVDGCRIEGAKGSGVWGTSNKSVNPDRTFVGSPDAADYRTEQHPAGRWPANVVLSHTSECREVGTRKVKSNSPSVPQPDLRHVSGRATRLDATQRNGDMSPGYADADGTETVTAWECHESCPVRMLDEQSGERTSGSGVRRPTVRRPAATYGLATGGLSPNDRAWDGDTGGASRFYYCAKASRSEREAGLDGMPGGSIENVVGHVATPLVRMENGAVTGERQNAPRTNAHPTVKPIALMRWLCRLVTPPGGLILDPFAGSFTTGCAAALEGFQCLGMEQDADYLPIARARLKHWAQVAIRARQEQAHQLDLL